jgi:hypothetical protein
MAEEAAGAQQAATGKKEHKGRRIFIQVSDEHYAALEKWAKDHDRDGGANEAARVFSTR